MRKSPELHTAKRKIKGCLVNYDSDGKNIESKYVILPFQIEKKQPQTSDSAANSSCSCRLMFSPNNLCLLFHYSSSCFHALTVVFHAHSSGMIPLSFKFVSKGQLLPQTQKSKHTIRRQEKCTCNLTEGRKWGKFLLILIAPYFKSECWLLRRSVKRLTLETFHYKFSFSFSQ